MTDAVQSCTLRAARNHQRPAMEGWSGAGSLKTWGCLIDTNKEPAINNSSMKGGIPDAGITIATITRRQRWTQEGSIIDTGLTAKQIPTGNIFSSFTFIKKKKKKKAESATSPQKRETPWITESNAIIQRPSTELGHTRHPHRRRTRATRTICHLVI